MNENIDLTEILKDVPKGIPFWSSIYGEVKLDGVHHFAVGDIVIVIAKDGERIEFKKGGELFDRDYGTKECLLFPSKEQRDWSKFKFITTFKENEPIMCYNDVDGWVLRTATGVNDDVYGRKRDCSFIERIRVSDFDFENQCKKK